MSDHRIKSCSVVLAKHEFSKIHMGCSATLDGEKLECAIQQEGVDSFCIKINRKHDGMHTERSGLKQMKHGDHDCSEENPSKGIFIGPNTIPYIN